MMTPVMGGLMQTTSTWNGDGVMETESDNDKGGSRVMTAGDSAGAVQTTTGDKLWTEKIEINASSGSFKMKTQTINFGVKADNLKLSANSDYTTETSLSENDIKEENTTLIRETTVHKHNFFVDMYGENGKLFERVITYDQTGKYIKVNGMNSAFKTMNFTQSIEKREAVS